MHLRLGDGQRRRWSGRCTVVHRFLVLWVAKLVVRIVVVVRGSALLVQGLFVHHGSIIDPFDILLLSQITNVRFVVVDDRRPQIGRVARQSVQLTKHTAFVHRPQLVDGTVDVAVVSGGDFSHQRRVVVVQPAAGPVLDRSALQGAGRGMMGVVVML